MPDLTHFRRLLEGTFEALPKVCTRGGHQGHMEDKLHHSGRKSGKVGTTTSPAKVVALNDRSDFSSLNDECKSSRIGINQCRTERL
ncbi:uncharacterized protein PGTG_20735 [Puccinia graminis f. sp. tritici CRL 75-36-700-3]|uniref:Uncharacterized protein n=1 Tax=Puccinia graminis f. sp. tritici (strain CRL 75-36-700-3 / race SCCL) TaxID=418459 RepID=H6QP36_PUCGT|nr:uncharacterized protein PGTG_20735 [Puccinia graminis f. sp. tritici CRL 75-36-700-3]EHS63150.1 hypothetical protein PGTG_20735 [Puccinia graminis f. sp. tritici CRL 75-36-700-3]